MCLNIKKEKKITKCPKRQKQFEDKEQASEPDLDMAAMLELLGQELETTMNNMLRTQMERKKKGSMQEQTE